MIRYNYIKKEIKINSYHFNKENLFIKNKHPFFCWFNGVWKNNIWENGTWWNGYWHSGIWKNGVWHDGIWHDGIWKNGIWLKGQILNPFTNELEYSKVNPAEYYKKIGWGG